MIQQPLVAAARAGQYDVVSAPSPVAVCRPGGCGASRISKALDLFRAGSARHSEEGRLPYRDSRVVERKKYGRAKARKSFQFSKR